MCGLNMGLVSGAHIFPVSAPGSNDQPTNGLALCENHHRAFDRHKIWVHPVSRILRIHPKMLECAANDKRDNVFVGATQKRLSEPKQKVHLPDRKMFEERYSYYEGFYEWA